MPFKFTPKEIPDVVKIISTTLEDERGFFEELFKTSDFGDNRINYEFKQDNHSFSRKGVVRGLHFQHKPYEQGKLVFVIYGNIFDVAVDVRPLSDTFGKWVSEELSGENHKMLWIPKGFAHGFMALGDSHVIYKTTEEFAPDYEDGIIWNDPDLSVKWPLLMPIVSQKDSRLKTFRDIKELLKGDIS